MSSSASVILPEVSSVYFETRRQKLTTAEFYRFRSTSQEALIEKGEAPEVGMAKAADQSRSNCKAQVARAGVGIGGA